MTSIRVSLLDSPPSSFRLPRRFGPWCGGGDRPIDLGAAQSAAERAGPRLHREPRAGPPDSRPPSNQKRDVYVYVPPGYRCAQRYPLVIWLHGRLRTSLDSCKWLRS